MYIKDGIYRSIKPQVALPIAEGTVLTINGLAATADTAYGIVPTNVTALSPTKQIYVAVSGTIDLKDPANKAVSFSQDMIKALGRDFNFVPAEEGSSGLPEITESDVGKVLEATENGAEWAEAGSGEVPVFKFGDLYGQLNATCDAAMLAGSAASTLYTAEEQFEYSNFTFDEIMEAAKNGSLKVTYNFNNGDIFLPTKIFYYDNPQPIEANRSKVLVSINEVYYYYQDMMNVTMQITVYGPLEGEDAMNIEYRCMAVPADYGTGAFYVTGTFDGTIWSLNASYQDIENAIEGGRTVILAKDNSDESMDQTIYDILLSKSVESGVYSVAFNSMTFSASSSTANMVEV